MSRDAWVTPDNPGTGKRCRVVRFPDSDACEGIVAGALLLLSYPDNWEQLGTATPDEMANLFAETVSEFNKTELCMPVGAILPYGGSNLPDYYLLCDGSEYLQTDYPELYDAIGDTFGAATPGYFRVPDSRGRVLIGAGAGTGLTSRAVGDTGGDETVGLTAAQNGPHAHTTQPHTHGYVPASPSATTVGLEPPQPTAVPGVGVTDTAIVTVDSSGDGEAHENMPPFLAVNAIIRYR